MASEGGKIKSKRRQAASKPYERNLTLFGKLRKSVKDLLIPSWLLGSHQQSDRQATGDASQAVQVESNNFISGVQLHNTAGDGLVGLDQTTFVDLTKEHRESHLLGMSGHGEGSNIFIGEPYMGIHHADRVSGINSIATDRQDGELVSRKHEEDAPSTTELSGVHRQDPQQARVGSMRLRLSESCLSDAEDNANMTGARPIMTSTRVQNQTLDISHVGKKQKIWSPECNMQGKYLVSPVKEKPAFNSFLLGSMSDSAVFGDSFNKSVFYPGKTRFGGASAERRTSLNTSQPYQSSLPLRKQVRAHNVSNNIHATTSATAQRILETLDKMSTPLGDAKKIPVAAAESMNDSVLTFTPSSYRRTSFQTGRPMTRPLQLPSRGPPTSQHQALAQAVIAKNRYQSAVVDRRQQSVIVDDENDDVRMLGLATSQEPSGLRIQMNPSEIRINTLQQGGVLGKMKAKRFTQHISNAGTDDDQAVEMPNLRTDFTLPISNMGPITLQTRPLKPNAVTESSIPSSGQPVPLKFIFSAPIDEKRQLHGQIAGTADKNFKFTSPIKTSQAKTSAAGAEGASKTCQEPAVGASSGMPLWTSSATLTASVPAWGSTAPKPKVSSPDIGGTSSSFKSYSKWGSFEKQDDSSAASDTSGMCSLAPAAFLKTGSVMDILGGGKCTDDLLAKFKKPAGSWECGSCMLVNKPEATKCICCESARPGAKPPQTAPGTIPKSSTTTVSAPGSDIKASDKVVSGTSQYDASSKLKSSEAPKLGAKQPQNGTGISSENSLKALFKKPAGTWECDTCMVQNTAGSLRCIACDSSKPGLQTAGIVSKASVSSSGPSTITMSPAGGFTFNTSAMTTTTSGSGGFKFGNANSSSSTSTSLPSATGFIFGQTTLANKDSSSKSSSGSTASTSPASGFQFGVTSTEGDSGGTASGTSGFGGANSGSGFVFGNNSSKTLPTKTSDGVSGFQTVETVKVSDVSDSNSATCLITVANIQSDMRNNGISSTTDFSKSNSCVVPSAVVFPFGSALSTNSTTFPASSGLLQSGTEMNSKDNVKMSHPEVNFNFAQTSSTTLSLMTVASQSQLLDNPNPVTVKPASTLFQFGASSVVPKASTGLGMGSSFTRSESKPMVNGAFGSGFEVQTMKSDPKPASVDTNKSFGNFTFGTAPTNVAFGGAFGQAATPASEPIIVQTSQSSKRTVDFSEPDQPTAKKPFNFGTGTSEPSTNGLFAFSGSSESKASPFVVSSTAGSSTGGFIFNSISNPPATQTGGQTPGSAFQFPLGSSAAPAFQGFNFSFKAQNEGTKPRLEAPTNKGAMPYSTTPNFNFGAVPQQSGAVPQQLSVFQFGAKPVENSLAAPGIFTFAAAHPSGGATDGSSFGAPTGMGTVGNFSIGSGESGRKMKRAMRRIKK